MSRIENAPQKVQGICAAFIGLAIMFVIGILANATDVSNIAMSDKNLFYILMIMFTVLSLFCAWYSVRPGSDAYALSVIAAIIIALFGLVMMINIDKFAITYTAVMIICAFILLMCISPSARKYYKSQ